MEHTEMHRYYAIHCVHMHYIVRPIEVWSHNKTTFVQGVHSVDVTEHQTVLLSGKNLWGLHLFAPGYKCFLSQVRVYPQIPTENFLMILYSDCKIVVLSMCSWKWYCGKESRFGKYLRDQNSSNSLTEACLSYLFMKPFSYLEQF